MDPNPNATPSPTPTPTPTPTPPLTEDPPEVVTPIVDPVAVCDNKPGSPAPVIQYAAWVQDPDVDLGPSKEYQGCKERVREYHCEAAYVCSANGENVASGGVVADQVCLDHAFPAFELPS